ncbi:A24 family peptidase [Vibrio salinus]|uniref:A24 family peptidase n=1 Tax=Vibrio salinus TaxID=2899784 RepID=UPI001E29FD7C|nr:prepilin peptidase [Vibrio salinus]MCE0494312.1 prepilin peptidase [Vibrio salinus]
MTLYSLLNILVLGMLLLIGVFDLREHRIPNLCVFILLVLAVSLKLDGMYRDNSVSLWWDFFSGCLFFAFGLVLFLMGAMAPGDVKLLGVVGFFLGWNEALNGAFYLSVAMLIIGVFYYFYFRAQTCHPSVLSMVKDYFSHAEISVLSVGVLLRQCNRVRLGQSDKNIINRMPFAPVVVLGVTLFQYYS